MDKICDKPLCKLGYKRQQGVGDLQIVSFLEGKSKDFTDNDH